LVLLAIEPPFQMKASYIPCGSEGKEQVGIKNKFG
jgi:hypothetical protein